MAVRVRALEQEQAAERNEITWRSLRWAQPGNRQLGRSGGGAVGDPQAAQIVQIGAGVEHLAAAAAAENHRARETCADRGRMGDRQLGSPRRGPVRHPQVLLGKRVRAVEQHLAAEKGEPERLQTKTSVGAGDGNFRGAGAGPVGHPKAGQPVGVFTREQDLAAKHKEVLRQKAEIKIVGVDIRDRELGGSGGSPIGHPQVDPIACIEGVEQHLVAEDGQVVGLKAGPVAYQFRSPLNRPIGYPKAPEVAVVQTAEKHLAAESDEVLRIEAYNRGNLTSWERKSRTFPPPCRSSPTGRSRRC